MWSDDLHQIPMNFLIAAGITISMLEFGSLKAETWTVVQSGTTESLYHVVWHKGRFMASSGSGGVVITSEEGLTWNPFPNGSSNYWSEMKAVGDAHFAGGYPMTMSTDGVTWRATNLQDFPNDIAFGGGRFVSVNDFGKIWSSPDGIEWAPNTQGITSDSLNGVEHGNGVFVALGNDGTVLRSADGLSWELSTVPTQRGRAVTSLIWTGSRFRAVSNFREVFESSDGRIWKLLWMIPFYPREVVFGRGQYVAISSSAVAWESSDMKTWRMAELGSNAHIANVTYGEGRFVLVGDNGLIRVRTVPSIVDQPESLVVPIMGRIELDSSGVAEGAFVLQWLKDGRNLAGRTSTSLVIEEAELKDGGKYSVRLSASGGSDVSQTAAVGVVDPRPRTVVGSLGKALTFSILSGGVVEGVRWEYADGGVLNEINDGAGLAGATTKTIMIRSLGLNHEGDYSWRVGGVSGGPIRVLVATKKPEYTVGEIVLAPAIVGGSYEFQIPFPTDLEGAPSVFRASGLPAGMILDAATGRLYGRPTAASSDPAGHLVRLTLSNAFGNYSVAVRLKVDSLPPGVVGLFNGVVERGSELGGEAGGRFDLAVTKSGAYSGTLRLGARVVRFKGWLDVDITGSLLPRGAIVVSDGGGSVGALEVVFEVDGGRDEVDGWVSGGTGDLSVTAWRNTWNTQNRADVFGGYYTVALPLESPEAGSVVVPQGIGFVTFRVSAVSGMIQLSGRLSDGTVLSSACFLGPFGQVMHYWVGYQSLTKGTVLGACSITAGTQANGADTSLSGVWTWNRPGDLSPKSRVYREGFGAVKLLPYGGKYAVPARSEVVMGLPVVASNPPGNAVLAFDKQIGDEAEAVNPDVLVWIKPGGAVVLPALAVNPQKTTLKLSVTTGLFSGGHVTRNDNPRPLPAVPRVVERKASYFGVLVNDGGAVRGVGYFLRAALPSAVLQDTPVTSPIYSGEVRFQ